MIEDIKEVLNKSFEEVAASSLVLKLLSVYSKLYLNGGQPAHCSACMRDYYSQLKKNGMELAQLYLEAKNRTCKPKANGIVYIASTARHWNSELITDKDAIYLLEGKHMKPSDFEILPEAWGKPIPEEKVIKDFEKRHAPKAPKGRIVKKGA
jgi:hypothetical protein